MADVVVICLLILFFKWAAGSLTHSFVYPDRRTNSLRRCWLSITFPLIPDAVATTDPPPHFPVLRLQDSRALLPLLGAEAD